MPKDNLHPTYFTEAKVTCACGNAFTTGSTVAELRVEVCSNCHPFYTGKETLLDTEGRAEKFEKKRVAGETGRKVLAAKKAKETPQEQKKPLTLKELLEQG
ncbi:50S ribosomal protein L31 [candidate division WWE3 bacterium RIFCSPHIGHO2_01_FULL_48_15]|uniref:Large ribosomal subunit protein bL31 n=1 Tax=candidate division WWE3 bacterium RIFCSPHIGHO2_01_FULL_48_15 TaxID=1802619 RepID=A0A1F4VAJ5_UNCKA|nr:MAG: 50S ribosomal protein L31 [candidate division WWE3 bacterium RIFCSPHIGHO2_01_FULL_48_15]